MLVQEWMTTKVITVTPDTSVMKASRLMKDNNIRRLPVADAQGCLVGIVSDRDIKDASPSKATTLDMHELYYLLAEMKVVDIMTKHPISAKASDSIEGLAYLMTKKRFGGVPIVDDNNKVCGIISDSDIFKVLLSITGANVGGIQLAFELENKPGTLRPVMDALAELKVSVVSVLSSQETQDDPFRRVYVRLRPLAEDKQKTVIDGLKANFPLIYWEKPLQKL